MYSVTDKQCPEDVGAKDNRGLAFACNTNIERGGDSEIPEADWPVSLDNG